jgi:hypothetical protein
MRAPRKGSQLRPNAIIRPTLLGAEMHGDVDALHDTGGPEGGIGSP